MSRFAALCLALLLLAGCDSASSDAQLVFEATALLGTSDGVTPDDWRVGPIFGAGVSVTLVPSPNPAVPGERVTLQLYGDDGLGALTLYRRELNGDFEPVRPVQSESGPVYTFTFFASDASPTGTSGSSRLAVFDGFERVVTYGDLVLR